jgi:FkbM family methyltransferase
MFINANESGRSSKSLGSHYPVKVAKFHLYKRFIGSEKWLTRFAFERALRSIRPGDIAIDCGANIGKFTQEFAMRGAVVHAFEPDPWAFSCLATRMASHINVTCYSAAVGAGESDLILYRRPEFDTDPAERSTGSSLYRSKINVDPSCGIAVKQRNLNAFIRDLELRVRVLKIDIEGAEVPLLESMLEDRTIDLCDFVFVETHETRIAELAQRTEALKDIFKHSRYRSRVWLTWE